MAVAKRSVLVAVMAVIVASAPWGAHADPGPPPPYSPGYILATQPVSFRPAGGGFVSAKFHARKEGNRVFYAGSLKDTRRWLPFTGLSFAHLDFSRSGLLAIFSQPAVGGLGPLEVTTIEASTGSPSTLFIHAQFQWPCGVPYAPCPMPPIPRPEPWGRFTIVVIDKTTLIAPPERLYVTESQ